MLPDIKGLESLALTTNGVFLGEWAQVSYCALILLLFFLGYVTYIRPKNAGMQQDFVELKLNIATHAALFSSKTINCRF
jgi:hypothetical protein